MHDLLKEIIENKEKEIEVLKRNKSIKFPCMEQLTVLKSFKNSISKNANSLSFIGEIKRKSPSKGHLSVIHDPQVLLQEYIAGGVDAVSVLTDELYFSGSLLDLQKASHYLKETEVAVLRKEFILDSVQIVESVLAGAHAILLIVSVLKEKTKYLFDYANTLSLDVIVEVHTKEELDFALAMNASMIGINNRDLHTFSVDLNVCLELVRYIPDNVVKIAESGVASLEDIKKIRKAGFDAVLIGETLVTANRPAEVLKSMRTVV